MVTITQLSNSDQQLKLDPNCNCQLSRFLLLDLLQNKIYCSKEHDFATTDASNLRHFFTFLGHPAERRADFLDTRVVGKKKSAGSRKRTGNIEGNFLLHGCCCHRSWLKLGGQSEHCSAVCWTSLNSKRAVGAIVTPKCASCSSLRFAPSTWKRKTQGLV